MRPPCFAFFHPSTRACMLVAGECVNSFVRARGCLLSTPASVETHCFKLPFCCVSLVHFRALMRFCGARNDSFRVFVGFGSARTVTGAEGRRPGRALAVRERARRAAAAGPGRRSVRVLSCVCRCLHGCVFVLVCVCCSGCMAAMCLRSQPSDRHLRLSFALPLTCLASSSTLPGSLIPCSLFYVLFHAQTRRGVS